MGRLSSTFAMPYDWRCSSAETGVKKLPKVVCAINGQVQHVVMCTCVKCSNEISAP